MRCLHLLIGLVNSFRKFCRIIRLVTGASALLPVANFTDPGDLPDLCPLRDPSLLCSRWLPVAVRTLFYKIFFLSLLIIVLTESITTQLTSIQPICSMEYNSSSGVASHCMYYFLFCQQLLCYTAIEMLLPIADRPPWFLCPIGR